MYSERLPVARRPARRSLRTAYSTRSALPAPFAPRAAPAPPQTRRCVPHKKGECPMSVVAHRNEASSTSDDGTMLYLNEISRLPRLTPEEELELGARIAQGDEAALRRMVESNLRLVVSVAKRYRNEGLSL